MTAGPYEWTTTRTMVGFIRCGREYVRADLIESFEPSKSMTVVSEGPPSNNEVPVVNVVATSGQSYVFQGARDEFMKVLRQAIGGESA